MSAIIPAFAPRDEGPDGPARPPQVPSRDAAGVPHAPTPAVGVGAITGTPRQGSEPGTPRGPQPPSGDGAAGSDGQPKRRWSELDPRLDPKPSEKAELMLWNRRRDLLKVEQGSTEAKRKEVAACDALKNKRLQRNKRALTSLITETALSGGSVEGPLELVHLARRREGGWTDSSHSCADPPAAARDIHTVGLTMRDIPWVDVERLNACWASGRPVLEQIGSRLDNLGCPKVRLSCLSLDWHGGSDMSELRDITGRQPHPDP